jgi:malonyl-CoA/methylmalonyl-CoA synthetase
MASVPDDAAAAQPEWAVHLPSGTSAADVDLLGQRSLPASWSSRWASDPAAEVLRDEAGRSSSAARLEEATRLAAGRYAAAGLSPGDRILLCLPNSSELVVAHVAALRMGLVVVPANTSYTERELRLVLEDTQPRAAVVGDAERARWLSRWRDGSLVVTGPSLELPSGPAPRLDSARPEDPAMVCFTSGTTGTPKGAVLSHGNLLAGAEALRVAWRWAPDDRLVLPLPLFHVHGLAVGLHGSLHAGGSVLVLGRFGAEGTLAALEGHRATLLFGVPTTYHRLARTGGAATLARLRLCVSGSAPMPPDLHLALLELCGQRVLERYGMTETLIITSNPYEGERRPGTVGLPLPGVEVRVDQGSGRAGELLVRGPNVFGGYWRRQEATSAVLDGQGWFRTGDIAERDGDGYVSIVGRAKELIITGGYNVYPREIEDLLRQHPSVLDAAVIGAPSDDLGEEVVAYVVADGDPDPNALVGFVARDLAPYKLPRRVRFVEQIPRNAMGKVLRDELPGR